MGAELHGIYEFRRGGNLFERLPEETDIAEQLKHYIVGGQLNHEYFSKNQKHKLTSYISTQHTRRGSYYGGGGNSEDPEEREAAKNFYGNTDDIALVGGVQYSRFFSNVLGREATFTAGFEPNYNKVNDRMPGYGRSINQEVLNLGQYVQWEFRPLAKLKMLAGLRYDYAILEGSYVFGAGLSQQNDLQVGVLSPRLNFLYDLSPYWQLRAGYARGFRNPQAFDEDLHIQTLEGTALFTRLSPDLRQETSNSFTASLNITKPLFKNFNSPKSDKMNALMNSISICFSSTFKVLARVGNISFDAIRSLLSILLKIDVSISSSAATFLSGSPRCSRLLRKYSPNEFILSLLFGLILQKYYLFL